MTPGRQGIKGNCSRRRKYEPTKEKDLKAATLSPAKQSLSREFLCCTQDRTKQPTNCAVQDLRKSRLLE